MANRYHEPMYNYTHVSRLDYIIFNLITFVSQCNAWENRAALPGGRGEAYIIRRSPAFLSSCAQCFRVSIAPAVKRTLLRQMDMIIIIIIIITVFVWR